MYCGKKISVAIATYNGAKYIEQQLLSILRNHVRPDEIIISDDGSKDHTLDIVKDIACSVDSLGVVFQIYSDNKNHGFLGNFEHALSLSTGDYVFLADQDDIWLPTKVQKIIDAFLLEPSAGLIFHNADLIDAHGKSFHQALIKPGTYGDGTLNKLDRNQYLEGAISTPIVNGMCMCMSAAFLHECLPFPSQIGAHDHWLGFVAVANNQCIYYNECLAEYRLHGENTCGNNVFKGSLLQKTRRILKRILSIKRFIALSEYYLGKAMKNYMIRHNMDYLPAFKTAERVFEVGEKIISIEGCGNCAGAIALIHLYRNDIRYRRMGKSQFLAELLHVLSTSQNQRIQVIQHFKEGETP